MNQPLDIGDHVGEEMLAPKLKINTRRCMQCNENFIVDEFGVSKDGYMSFCEFKCVDAYLLKNAAKYR